MRRRLWIPMAGLGAMSSADHRSSLAPARAVKATVPRQGSLVGRGVLGGRVLDPVGEPPEVGASAFGRLGAQFLPMLQILEIAFPQQPELVALLSVAVVFVGYGDDVRHGTRR